MKHKPKLPAMQQSGYNRTRVAAAIFIAALGFFSITTQTLLFRAFSEIHNGCEFGISLFFAAWLLWVVIGSLVGLAAARANLKIRVELLALLYIPAAALQLWLYTRARNMTGTMTYEVIPLTKLIPLSLLLNAPVSLITGTIFPLTCQQLANENNNPLAVSTVYLFEALGSFIGGFAVTLLLIIRTSDTTILLLSMLVLCSATSIYSSLQHRKYLIALTLPPLLALLFSGAAPRLENNLNRAEWQRLMPHSEYSGSFRTDAARYLYGRRNHQLNVISQGSIIETIPNPEHAAEVAALCLAQQPNATNTLVIGAGSYSICRALSRYPTVKRITWLTPDPQYTTNLERILPASQRPLPTKTVLMPDHPRQFLTDHPRQKYNLVVINLPDPDNLIINQFFTLEFYQLLKKHLAPSAIVCVRLTADENFIGSELSDMGASIYATLKECFDHIAIKPGTESWLIAADTNLPTNSPATLYQRLKTINNSRNLFPPAGIFSLYPPDRAAFQLAAYRATLKNSGNRLLNTDRHPQALPHALLLTIRRQNSGNRLTRYANLITRYLPHWILLAFVLALAYRLIPYKTITTTPSGHYTLVCSTGAVALATSIMLLYLFQARFGSLYLYIGLLSSLFMLGIFSGARIASNLMRLNRTTPRRIITATLAAQIALSLAVTFYAFNATRPIYAALFIAFGILSGIYLPAVAAIHAKANLPIARSGALLDACDHLGGAVGGLITGLLLLPILGASTTLLLLAAILALHIPEQFAPGMPDSHPSRQPLAYTFAAIVILALTVSHDLSRTAPLPPTADRLKAAAKYLLPNTIVHATTSSAPDGRRLTVLTGGSPSNRLFVISTAQFAPTIYGYNGPIDIAAALDNSGNLLALKVIRHHETPSYFKKLHTWLPTLRGKNIRQLANIDAVSGATISSQAILNALQISGNLLQNITGGKNIRQPAEPQRPFDAPTVILLTLLAIALYLRRHPGRIRRRFFLAAVVLTAGIWLNIQFSTANILTLAEPRLPPLHAGTAFLLTIIIPLITIIIGNLYCGWLCPIGALQELIGSIAPRKQRPSQKAVKSVRLLKYLLLGCLLLAFAISRNPELAQADPLTYFFSGHHLAFSTLAILILSASLLLPRFWCRTLCPTGAFLTILGRAKLLQRMKTHHDKARKKQSAPSNAPAKSNGNNLPDHLLFAALAVMLLIWLRDSRLATRQTATSTHPSTSTVTQPVTQLPADSLHAHIRTVNLPLLQRMIEAGALSDHEARFWHTTAPINESDSGHE